MGLLADIGRANIGDRVGQFANQEQAYIDKGIERDTNREKLSLLKRADVRAEADLRMREEASEREMTKFNQETEQYKIREERLNRKVPLDSMPLFNALSPEGQEWQRKMYQKLGVVDENGNISVRSFLFGQEMVGQSAKGFKDLTTIENNALRSKWLQAKEELDLLKEKPDADPKKIALAEQKEKQTLTRYRDASTASDEHIRNLEKIRATEQAKASNKKSKEYQPVGFVTKDGTYVGMLQPNDPRIASEGLITVDNFRKIHPQKSARTKQMAEQAPKVKEFVTDVNSLIDKMDKKYPDLGEEQSSALGLGPASSRWRNFWSGTVGTSDTDFTELRTNMDLLTTMLMQMHVGARGGEYIMDHFKDMLAYGKQHPDNLRAAVKVMDNYASMLIDAGKEGTMNIPESIGEAKGILNTLADKTSDKTIKGTLTPQKLEYTQEDLKTTAEKYNMTVDEVKKMLEQNLGE